MSDPSRLGIAGRLVRLGRSRSGQGIKAKQDGEGPHRGGRRAAVLALLCLHAIAVSPLRGHPISGG